ncbi:hypothetical protein AYI68_g409 [Smittium mucronatum]|uniref:Uncharacterized protein n=1 Tax=Smittium mucronatum TaxID=133383 RepID=A0A1R0H8E8_9FUNG|nr:hypothetical protein AYI68_g409 [Smittium mucronatum]
MVHCITSMKTFVNTRGLRKKSKWEYPELVREAFTIESEEFSRCSVDRNVKEPNFVKGRCIVNHSFVSWTDTQESKTYNVSNWILEEAICDV